MYNAEIKERFFEESGLVDSTIRMYRYILEKATSTEEELGKDVYEFTPYECDQLINSFARKSEGIIYVIITCLKQYVDFCKINNLTADNFNYFSTLTGVETIKKYLDVTAVANKHISYEQLLELEGLCYNAQDAVIPELLFIGVKGEEAAELLELREECIFPDKIVLPDREIAISERTYQLIKDAIDPNGIYHRGNGETDGRIKKLPLSHSEYVLKPVGTKQKGQLTYAALQARVIKIKNYFDNPYLTPTNIWVSGQIHLAKQIMAEKGELTKEDYQYIGSIFGIDKSQWSQIKFKISGFI
jgi:hypothetical protein